MKELYQCQNTIDTTLLGKWCLRENVSNTLGSVECQDVLVFDERKILNWYYYETGAPDEFSVFFYRVSGDKLFLRSANYLNEIEAAFEFDAQGHLYLKFEDYTMQLTRDVEVRH